MNPEDPTHYNEQRFMREVLRKLDDAIEANEPGRAKWRAMSEMVIALAFFSAVVLLVMTVVGVFG